MHMQLMQLLPLMHPASAVPGNEMGLLLREAVNGRVFSEDDLRDLPGLVLCDVHVMVSGGGGG